MQRIGVIYGSDREGRFCDVVGGWVRAQLSKDPDLDLDLIDPLELRLPLRMGGTTTALRDLQGRLASADAFIVITPEYNRSFPATLKALIDSANDAWHAKPVAFVSYGGVSGGLRAVEQLRLVFSELHAATLRDSVAFPDAWDRFVDGRPVDEARALRALRQMVARLKWWSDALRQARQARPYLATAA